MIHVTPIPSTIELDTPAFTLGVTNTAGASTAAVSANSTLLAFDATLPDAITYGQSGAVGSATVASRRDHAHAMAAADTVTAASAAEVETATSTTVFVSPGTTKYHPGVAKCWGSISSDGSLSQGYNCSSGKDSTGVYTVTIGDDFDTTTYARLAAMREPVPYVCTTSNVAVGSYKVRGYNTTDQSAIDIDFGTVAFGNQ